MVIHDSPDAYTAIVEDDMPQISESTSPWVVDENLIARLVERGTITETVRRLRPDKKNRLYRSAVRLFGKFGYDGLSVDRFCTDAGISKGSFFQYFPSKSHLLEFAVLIFDDYLGHVFTEIKRTETGALARLRLRHLLASLLVNARARWFEERFYLCVTRALEHSAVVLEGVDLGRHLADHVEEIIQRGVETGELRGDIDVALVGRMVSDIIGEMARRTGTGRESPHRQIENDLMSLLYDGIKA